MEKEQESIIKFKQCFFVFLIQIFVFTNYCSSNNGTDPGDQNPGDSQGLSGPYLGQTPPGMTPVKFAQEVLTSNERVFCITFSPDGKECYYTRADRIYVINEENGIWTYPRIAPFASSYSSMEPYINLIGNRLYFASDRPVPGSTSSLYRQWFVQRTGSVWGEPENLDLPFENISVLYPSISNNGNMYFHYWDGNNNEIYVSRFENGDYQEPVSLGENINFQQYSAHPFIAPDESYLIFDSHIEGVYSSLYISFKSPDGSWGEAINMGILNDVNFASLCPFVTRDNNYLFFSRITETAGSIYWVDASIIEDLRPTN